MFCSHSRDTNVCLNSLAHHQLHLQNTFRNVLKNILLCIVIYLVEFRFSENQTDCTLPLGVDAVLSTYPLPRDCTALYRGRGRGWQLSPRVPSGPSEDILCQSLMTNSGGFLKTDHHTKLRALKEKSS